VADEFVVPTFTKIKNNDETPRNVNNAFMKSGLTRRLEKTPG